LDGNGYSENPTPQRKFEVGEVTVLKDDPLSVDLTMVPDSPTATKVLFPDVTAGRNLLLEKSQKSMSSPSLQPILKSMWYHSMR